MAVATEVIRRSGSTLAGLFTKKLPAGIWQFTFDEVGKGMKYAVNGRRYEFMAINGVMGITIDATNEKQLWYVISDDCTVQIEEVGQAANPFSSIAHETGLWTPELTGTVSNPTYTVSSAVGYWTKISNLVHYHLTIAIDTWSADGSGTLRIPFPFTANGNAVGSLMLSGVNLASANYNYAPYIGDTAEFFTIRQYSDNAAWGDLQLGVGIFSSSDILVFTGTVRI